MHSLKVLLQRRVSRAPTRLGWTLRPVAKLWSLRLGRTRGFAGTLVYGRWTVRLRTWLLGWGPGPPWRFLMLLVWNGLAQLRQWGVLIHALSCRCVLGLQARQGRCSCDTSSCVTGLYPTTWVFTGCDDRRLRGWWRASLRSRGRRRSGRAETIHGWLRRYIETAGISRRGSCRWRPVLLVVVWKRIHLDLGRPLDV